MRFDEKFVGDQSGHLTGIETVKIEWENGELREVKNSEQFWKAENVFLAIGFTGIEKLDLFEKLNVNVSQKNTICVAENKQTNVEKIFAAGDCERGQSLIVWAIADGRVAAKGVNDFLLKTVNN